MDMDVVESAKNGDDTLNAAVEFYLDENGQVPWTRLENVLREEGLDIERDERIQKILSNIFIIKQSRCKDNIILNPCELRQAVPEEDKILISRALLRSLIINQFTHFFCATKRLFENMCDCDRGEVIQGDGVHPVTGKEWCVSIVSIDGQKASWGEKTTFTLDEICAPLIQGLAIDILGKDEVSSLVHDAPKYAPNRHSKNLPQNSEPSDEGWFLSDIAAILLCAMIKSAKIEDWLESVKHDYVLSYFKGLCCGEYLRFSNASYSQAKISDYKLTAMGHFLKAFSKSKSQIPHLDSGLDLVFQLRSMEVTTDTLATIGAVLANGGSSPFTNQTILSRTAVTGLLTSMYAKGFGQSSAMFAIQGGVPGICTESGAVLIVIPGILGMGLFSPKVEHCCSVRAYNFAAEFIETNGFHPHSKLDQQAYGREVKSLKRNITFEPDQKWPIFIAVSKGNEDVLRSLTDKGVDLMRIRDHSCVSLLHVAAAHGHLDLVKLILCKSPSLLTETDMWCRKASHYAEKTGHSEVFDYLVSKELSDKKCYGASHLEPFDSFESILTAESNN